MILYFHRCHPPIPAKNCLGDFEDIHDNILTLNRLPLEIRDKCRGERENFRVTLAELRDKIDSFLSPSSPSTALA
jgi:hypothetical protein